MTIGKAVLGVSSLAFITYGLLGLISPAIPTGFAGLEISNADAFAEAGGMYGGLQTGLGLFCLLALLKPDYYRAGLMLLALVVGALALGRLISLLLATGAVGGYTWGAVIFESVIALLAVVALLRE